MTIRNLISILALTGMVSLLHASPIKGQREVLLENERVLVVRLTYPAGSESGMHTHEYDNRVAFFIKGGKVEQVWADPEKAPLVVEAEDGEVLYLPAATHNIRNIGDTEIVIIETELK